MTVVRIMDSNKIEQAQRKKRLKEELKAVKSKPTVSALLNIVERLLGD